jgi:hypothetical protein
MNDTFCADNEDVVPTHCVNQAAKVVPDGFLYALCVLCGLLLFWQSSSVANTFLQVKMTP